jgi:hypothetical protein
MARAEVEQNLQTINGGRTITFDSKTGHLFTMSQGAAVLGSFTILMIGK